MKRFREASAAICPAVVLLFVFLLSPVHAKAAAEPVLYMQGIPQIIHLSDMNDSVTAKIMIGGVSDFTAISFIIVYNSNALEIADADSERAGVNLLAADIFDTVYLNEVQAMDDGLSRIQFVGVVYNGSVSSDPVTVAQMTLKGNYLRNIAKYLHFSPAHGFIRLF